MQVRSTEEEVGGGLLLRNEQKKSEERGSGDARREPSRNLDPSWKPRGEVGRSHFDCFTAASFLVIEQNKRKI